MTARPWVKSRGSGADPLDDMRRGLHLAIPILVWATPAHAADVDGDRLDDAWEVQFFGDLLQGGTDDPDGDGILDRADRCPQKPEDKDGWEDADGCPEADDDPDGDRIFGPGDACPLESEDFDGVDDHDGCPDVEDAGGAPPVAN